MYAHKEIITLDDPQRLTLTQPLPLPKGQQVEILIVAKSKADSQLHRNEELLRSIREKSQLTEEQAFELAEEINHNIWNQLRGKVFEDG